MSFSIEHHGFSWYTGTLVKTPFYNNLTYWCLDSLKILFFIYFFSTDVYWHFSFNLFLTAVGVLNVNNDQQTIRQERKRFHLKPTGTISGNKKLSWSHSRALSRLLILRNRNLPQFSEIPRCPFICSYHPGIEGLPFTLLRRRCYRVNVKRFRTFSLPRGHPGALLFSSTSLGFAERKTKFSAMRYC